MPERSPSAPVAVPAASALLGGDHGKPTPPQLDADRGGPAIEPASIGVDGAGPPR